MDALIENAPRIISEAAKSPLGLAALVVLAVSVLSYAFFRRTAEHVRLLVFIPTFAGLILLVIALADVDRFRPSPPLRGDDRDDGSVRTPQSAFSLADAPDDFVVEVHVHFMNSNEEGRWILILDRISGLGKAVF